MMFADRFDPDDTVHRVLTLVQMFGAVVMAVFIEGLRRVPMASRSAT